MAGVSGGQWSWQDEVKNWNVGLAKDLRDAEFAREFLLAAIDEGVDLQLALGEGDPRDGRQGVCRQGALRLSLAPLPGKTRSNAA